MRNFIVVIFVLSFLFTAEVYATAQYPDKLIYNGKEYKLHSNPMEEYFKTNPEKKPKSDIMSTALWRGYVATFEIADNSLLLKDIQIKVRKTTSKESFATEWKSVFKDVVPGEERLKIDWFSGILVLPEGEVVNYVHMGYGSTYERYTLLAVRKGDFKDSRSLDYKEYETFREKQFLAFKKTIEYKNFVEKMKKERNHNDDFIDSFLKSFITDYTSAFLDD